MWEALSLSTAPDKLVTGNDAESDTVRQRVLKDAERTPEQWLATVRTRLREGDVAGARASLRLFVERHPQRAVPADLRPLLQQ